MTLAFTVHGAAEPKGNHRALLIKGMKFPIVTETNKGVKSWQQLVSQGADLALNALPPADRALLVDGVRLSVAFYLPRPKSLPRRHTAHTKAPDVDKLLRAILDALTHVIFRDDSQVCELVAVKHYAAEGDVPHVDITVAPTQGVEALPVEQSLFAMGGR
jgi:crossover junction endodeoxyribonuclease RusA